MNRIRLLPEQVVNQIAAGEVIERPASVVKELVENSLDAGARQVRVAFHAGGRSAITVTDDGCGMSRDDALLCLERHGTSKIAAAEDILSIHTLGFRGEAIPSIASVSRFTLTTREHDAPSGTRVEIAGGKILNVQETGAAPGTTVEVRSLFFNLPARRKFLRTPQTESAHIHHIVTLHALAQPAVAWRLQEEERVVLDLAPARSLGERIREIHGAEFFQDLVPVTALEGPVRVSGFVGRPGVSRATRDQQHVFVNGRPVESRGVNFALLEAYHTALMRGRFPIAFLFIEVEPDAVDVNIHPTKREVRFRDEYAVRAAVTEAVRRVLEPQAASAPVQPVHFPLAPEPVGASSAPVEQSLPLAPSWNVEHRASSVSQAGAPAPEIADASRSSFPVPPSALRLPPSSPSPWRILGVIGRLYVLIETAEGLVLLDQHAAHERVLFEQMLKQLERGGAAPSQRLLMPITLEQEARDAAFVKENLPVFHRMGIGLSEFGPRTFLVDALPPWLPARVDMRQLFRDVLDEVRAGGASLSKTRLGEDAVATTVCRHAVKAHDPLSLLELESLLRELRACDLPYTCPHGRPTMIQLSYAELEKKFGRRS